MCDCPDHWRLLGPSGRFSPIMGLKLNHCDITPHVQDAKRHLSVSVNQIRREAFYGGRQCGRRQRPRVTTVFDGGLAELASHAASRRNSISTRTDRSRRRTVGSRVHHHHQQIHAQGASPLPKAIDPSSEATGGRPAGKRICKPIAGKGGAEEIMRGLREMRGHYAASPGRDWASSLAQVASSVRVATRAAASGFQYEPGIDPSLLGRRIHERTVASETGKFAWARMARIFATDASWMILL